ncbi:hypothetical protein AB6M97_08770 [Streptococcus hillyeri]|uniref:hypothetical protein n=1 Tax=Streptococcus hillyeri TaxID=2282420 RepID=UPI0034E1BBCA
MNHKIVIFLANGKTFAFENVEEGIFDLENGQLKFKYFGNTHQEKKVASFDTTQFLGWSTTEGLNIKVV